MIPPNRFDRELGLALDHLPAEQCLALIANSPMVLDAVRQALADYDAKEPPPNGPSRAQIVRKTIVQALEQG